MAVNILDTIFGSSPEVQAAAKERDSSFQSWLDSRKQATEQARTDARRMATFNAFGNVLTNMFQPVAWKQGGATTQVTPPDNRQYLEAFNRAVQANEDLRNIGTMEGEYRFNLANDAYKRAMDFEGKQREAALDAEYAKQRHQYVLEEIAARGDVQKQVALIRASRVTKDGKPVSADNLKTAYTQWYRYLGRYWDDVGRGVVRKEKGGPLSLAEFLSSPEGGGYKVEYDDSAAGSGTGSGDDFSQYKRDGSSNIDFSQYKVNK